MSKILGIDLGTTTSSMAIIEDGQARIIANAEGQRTTPSAIGFTTETDYVVGQRAVEHVLDNPTNTVTSIKRFMGLSFTESEKALGTVTYNVVRGYHDSTRVRIKTRERTTEEINAMLQERIAQHGLDLEGGNLFLTGINGHDYFPEELSSFILAKLKADAQAALGEEVRDVVITVPAYFNDSQRQATRAAGRLAGFNVLRIISEPTAAALAYGVGDPRVDENVLIFDLGGGTFDVSILQIRQGVFQVLATSGDNHLGGDDWDMRLMVHLSCEFNKEHGFQLLEHDECLQTLKNTALKVKIALSSVDETRAFVPNVVTVDGVSYDLDCTITRKQFEDMTRLLRGRLDIPVHTALKDAGITYKDLDRVVLVGGSTRIPSVRELVKRHTRLEPVEGVNPDEAVAMGAAIQAGLLTGEVAGIELCDVTPLSLGIAVHGGIMDVLIPRNTPIPASVTEVYETTSDNQSAVTIGVYQGERGMAVDNKSLGQFRLEGVPPMPAGHARIEVTFDIDGNGIVSVSARELSTGVEQSIHITGSTSMSDEEIEAMMAEGAAHDAEDALYEEWVHLGEEATSLLRGTRKGLKRYASRVSQEGLQEIYQAMASLEQALGTSGVGEENDGPVAAVWAQDLAVAADGAIPVPDPLTAECNDVVRACIDRLREARKPLEASGRMVRTKDIGWQA